MAKPKYEETERFEDVISPIGTFEGHEIVRIRNNETGEETTGRGRTYEEARDRAVSQHIENEKNK
ncbi:hypothetical protein [Rhodomicrobium lacus]|uniref:hypothetical protein n=1 Tax=Rhodomicrobium lacus TaxID=2498452 RepID=UPI000F8DD539|nr:hypothetical protein [Rhodomicrobium lacus]WKW51321.1 hypothetical protein QMO75_02170 [Rhodomicrobium lacus]